MTSQNAKGPAEAATSPDHGSITHPCMRKDEMNVETNSTAPAEAPDPLLAASRRAAVLLASLPVAPQEDHGPHQARRSHCREEELGWTMSAELALQKGDR